MSEPREMCCPICRHGRRCRRRRDWWECEDCGSSFRSPTPSQDELDRYYEDAASSAKRPLCATTPPLARQYAQLIQGAVGDLEWQGSRVLDYGAGSGELSSWLLTLGAEIVPVEPYGSRPSSEKGTETLRSLAELEGGDAFDGIVMTEVIEHVREPVRVLRDLRSHLKKDGWIFVTTPNNESLKARLLRGRWSERRKFGHLYLFSRRGLELSLSAGGFGRVFACQGRVSFATSKSRSLMQYLLQQLHLDGQLRVMGWNNEGGPGLGE